MLYCKADRGYSALNFISNISTLPDESNFSSAISAPNIVYSGVNIAEGEVIIEDKYFFLQRDKKESATIKGMITCAGLIAYRGQSQIFVYHAPSGMISAKIISLLKKLYRTGAGPAYAVYAIPEERHICSYEDNINKVANCGFSVCIVSKKSSITNVSVNGALDLYFI